MLGPSPNGSLIVGLDVGSTTVKAVVVSPHDPACRDMGTPGVEPQSFHILWSDYQYHEARQPEKVLEFLGAIEGAFPGRPLRLFATGSGADALAPHIGAKCVQEVNAVALAVEHFHPDVNSVIELGGQDAKIIIWMAEERVGGRRKLTSMNDKCAGGTGATIDRIAQKLGLDHQALASFRFDARIHSVAGKCGVFAETDINSLQKQGVSNDELIASLMEALVQQNLSVLTRGNILRPKVLLLGGPNSFLPVLREAWQAAIPRVWQERGVAVPEEADPAELIFAPENSLLYAALGAVIYGMQEGPSVGAYEGTAALEEYIREGRRRILEKSSAGALYKDQQELEEFTRAYAPTPFKAPAFFPGELVEAHMGIDGGSTTTKGVLIDREGEILAKAYRLSEGNPLADAKEILRNLREQVEGQGAHLRVLGLGVTGYAKDILKEALLADVAVPETVAHTRSALRYYPDVEVITDVGGQDIKVMILRHGRVKDFRLNTQCSAGNGYFLQNSAGKFGHTIYDYADIAFAARRAPSFHYGCAVFLEQDIINFQQLGWRPHEILAALAQVLPKNVWIYVVQEPNLAKLGKSFLLQGGSHYNMAVVKAQHDFIKARVPDARVYVHPYAGECGAQGAALEALRVVGERGSRFIGFAAAEALTFDARRDEETRCYFCRNRCLRTFVDIQMAPASGSFIGLEAIGLEEAEPAPAESRRFIIATCDRGTTEDVAEVRAMNREAAQSKKLNPNFAEIAAREAFRSYRPPLVQANGHGNGHGLLGLLRGRDGQGEEARQRRQGRPTKSAISWGPRQELRGELRIGIPRVLALYSYAPFFTAYLEAIGIKFRNIIWSDYTSDGLYREGSRRGSIDPCFPAKVALAHVHNLLFRKKVDLILNPIVFNYPTELTGIQAPQACPSVQIAPEACRASLTTEQDTFAELGIPHYAPVFHLGERNLAEQQIYEFFRELLGVSREENRQAVAEGWRAYEAYLAGLRQRARDVLEQMEQKCRVGIVMLARPYHNDPGLNHEIPHELQKLGYPIFTIDSLPTDEDILERLFGEEVRRGEIDSPMSIADVWKNSYSENTNRKVWAAKYVARHPNLVAIDLSSFKCGMDAPIYHVVDGILAASGTPFFTFHELDENRPAGSIKLRVETLHYFLQLYQEELRRRRALEEEIEAEVQAYRQRLLAPAGLNPHGSTSSP